MAALLLTPLALQLLMTATVPLRPRGAPPIHASAIASAADADADAQHASAVLTTVFRSNFTEPVWVAIYHIPVLLSIPLPPTLPPPARSARSADTSGSWRMLAFAEVRVMCTFA